MNASWKTEGCIDVVSAPVVLLLVWSFQDVKKHMNCVKRNESDFSVFRLQGHVPELSDLVRCIGDGGMSRENVPEQEQDEQESFSSCAALVEIGW